MTGAAETVKQLEHVTGPLPACVTTTSRAPGAAVAATEIIRVSTVALFHVTDFTVTPPAMATVAPDANPVPFSFTVRHEADCPSVFGESDVTVTVVDAVGTTTFDGAD